MEILEKIEVSARLLAEIISVVLITNRQHKTANFGGRKQAVLRVLTCFRGEWCSGGARKRVYVKYHLFWCIFPQLNSTHRCRVPAPDAISYNHSDIKQS
ncbi:hypothetical protein [Escherichia coli]|uniref:hypothetical protein n=1 Tax=Escherichia coli TaxID=562 RepID=UPI0013154BDD|nr:hypothetical protein [Escherichia coli]